MVLVCPHCKSFIDYESKSCKKGHQFSFKNEVLTVFEEEFQAWYPEWENKFQNYRKNEGLRIEDTTVYDRLPYVSDAEYEGNWKAKRQDLLLIEGILNRKKNLEVVDFGAWNGWLSHHLSAWGHNVFAFAYFSDEFDGLGAHKYYKNTSWKAIQINMENTSVIGGNIDCIIVNRVLNYMVDPVAFLDQMKQKLNPGGVIICTGVLVAKDRDLYLNTFENELELFREKKGFSIRHKAFYGALSTNDIDGLKEKGFQFNDYSQSIVKSLKRFLIKKNTKNIWGIYEKS